MFGVGEVDGDSRVAVLAAAARDVASAAVCGDGDGELIVRLARLETVRRDVEAAMAHVAGELDVRGAVEARTGLRTASWVAHEFCLPRAFAGGLVRSGVFLRRLDVLDSAFREGRIGLDHVRFVNRWTNPRNSEVVEAVQEQLVVLADGVHFETWAAQVKMLLELADEDGSHDPRPEDNRLSLVNGLDASVLRLEGDLVGANAVEVRAALEAEADRLFHAYRQDSRSTNGEITIPGRAQLLAEALVELCRKGRANGQNSAAPVADVTIVFEAPPDLDTGHLAQQLGGRRRGSGCRGADGGDDSSAEGGEVAALRAWMDGLRARTLDGLPIPPRVAELLCCDPQVRALVLSAEGEALWHGRAKRLATRAQRNAAAVRDGGCCFPGCDAPPSWCDCHHVEEWDADHGPTDMPNLPLLCRRHHGLVHRNGWAMRALPGQRFEFTSPHGQTLPAQRHRRVPGRPSTRPPSGPPGRPPAPA